MLPEHLIDHIIRVEVGRRDSDVRLWLTAAQGVRSEDDDITDSYRPLPDLTEERR